MSDTKEYIQKLLDDNKVVLFMKGNRNFPQCGFSAATIDVINKLGVPYETVDVLGDQAVREEIKQFSNWPTIPQLYVDGKFIGGCDIVMEMHQKNELEPIVKSAFAA